MAEGVVRAQSQAADLLGQICLQSGIDAVCAGLKLIHAAESSIERLLIGIRRKASVANRLVTIQLNLIWLMNPACADVIDPCRALRANTLFNPEVILVVIRCLERAAGKGIHAHGQRACWRARLNARAGRRTRAENFLKALVSSGRCIHRASCYIRRYPDAAHLAADAADKGW